MSEVNRRGNPGGGNRGGNSGEDSSGTREGWMVVQSKSRRNSALRRHKVEGGLPVDRDVCIRCLGKGHHAVVCREHVRCLQCREAGHRRRHCPLLRQPSSKPEGRVIQDQLTGGQFAASGGANGMKILPGVVEIPWSAEVEPAKRMLESCVVISFRKNSKEEAVDKEEGRKRLQELWPDVNLWCICRIDIGSFLVRTDSESWRSSVCSTGRLEVKEGVSAFVSPWKVEVGTDPAEEGIEVWCKLFGVPLHLWNVNSFHAICSKFGRLREVDGKWLRGDNLSFARVKVSVDQAEGIPDRIKISAMGAAFWVRVEKETSVLTEQPERDWSWADVVCEYRRYRQRRDGSAGTGEPDCDYPPVLEEAGTESEIVPKVTNSVEPSLVEAKSQVEFKLSIHGGRDPRPHEGKGVLGKGPDSSSGRTEQTSALGDGASLLKGLEEAHYGGPEMMLTKSIQGCEGCGVTGEEDEQVRGRILDPGSDGVHYDLFRLDPDLPANRACSGPVRVSDVNPALSRRRLPRASANRTRKEK